MGRANSYNNRLACCVIATAFMVAGALGLCECRSASDEHTRTSSGEMKLRKVDEEIVVYVRDILNTTDFMTVTGATDIAVTGTSAPFGSVFTVDDPAYASEEDAIAGAEDAEVGRFRGTSTFVSLDGHDMMLQVNLRLYDPEGTVSLLGVFSYVDRSRPLPIVGGTGAYLSASGSATFAPIDEVPGDDQILRLALDLYLPTTTTTAASLPF